MMSRPSHLPPRCPLQNKCLRTRSLDSSEQVLQEDDQFLPELVRYHSMDSLFEEHPSWLDDLLTDSDTSPQGQCHRRSASDSLTTSHDNTSLTVPILSTALQNVVIHEPEDGTGSMHCGGGVETNCIYGPNSPRQRSKLTNSESAVVNAMLEKVPIKKLQFVEILGESRIYEPDQEGNASAEPEPERTSRRRSGQRSRVRKLQYISDLQKTVEALQTMGAELVAEAASLFQQRLALSLENKSLRKHVAVLLHEKIIKDGEYQYLKNEAERLKAISGRHRRSRSFSSSSIESGLRADGNYPPLDFRKPGLGEDSVTLNHDLGYQQL